MKTNVKSYTDIQILNRVKSLHDYKLIPDGYWLIFVRSNEDEYNKFDDKVYLFKSENFIMVTPCTTNKGIGGTAVIKSDQWLYDGFKNGLHKGKMEALRQNKPFYFYRDTNKDNKTDETGELFHENIYTNFHGSTYIKGNNKTIENIGKWSEGCIVCNINLEYEKIIDLTREQKIVSACLLKEW